ncbi:MAG: FecR family protein [Bacteroidota bacterium]
MPANNQPAKELISKYRQGTCTPEERAIVEAWYATWNEQEENLSEEQLTAAEKRVFDRLPKAPEHARTRTLWPRIAAAASVLLFLFAGGYFYFHNKIAQTQNTQQDVAPYTAQAILKTGGKTILLDKTHNGKITQQNNTIITKAQGEQIVYTNQNTAATQAVYDTIQVPAGGRPYQVKLADGSRITLNAATTLRYPESFGKDKREPIELISGEIYAEITHNSSAPLQVKTPGQLVTDIGTEFDISAYPDEEEQRTTLVEGAVKVAANNTAKTLKPGEQTIRTANTFRIAPANIEQTTAWKAGDFYFNGETIEVIMRQLARWYNIEVKYEGKVTKEVFYGKVTRKKNISEVLKMLEKTQKVHFKVEGRRVTVLSRS